MQSLPDRHMINNEMFDDTIRQIVKDLRLDHFPPVDASPESTAFEQIYHSLLPIIQNMMTSDTSALPQVLYQVDLRESLVKEILYTDTPAENLTVAIIRRCFQKIVLRRLYSTKSR